MIPWLEVTLADYWDPNYEAWCLDQYVGATQEWHAIGVHEFVMTFMEGPPGLYDDIMDRLGALSPPIADIHVIPGLKGSRYFRQPGRP